MTAEERTAIAQPDPTKRLPTRFPGVTYRLNAKGERRYQINYTDSNGKRIWKKVEGQLKDAVRERNLILERMHRGERVVQSKMTVRELAEVYLNTQTGHLKPSTLKTYEFSLDHYVLPRIGRKRVSSFSVTSAAEFISELRTADLSAWTIRGCLTPMSRMFQYAVRNGWCGRNPVAELDRQERPKGDQRQMRILSSDEIQAVLAASAKGCPVTKADGSPLIWNGKQEVLEGTYHLLFTVAIFTGLRMGELLRLRWEDVDLLEGHLTVRESKTKAGEREVVLPPFLVRALAAASLTQSDGEVFQTHMGTPMKHRRVNRALEETLKRANVPHLRFHDLRHTYASILISNGENGAFIADQMGHSNPATTFRTYAKLFDKTKHREEARERMQANFEGVVA